MSIETIRQIRKQISNHPSNAEYKKLGIEPLFDASPHSKIVIVGQAPGARAQTSGIPWDDASGQRLMTWLGVSEAQFRDTSQFALLPMDFYYPGKGKSGDLPPRRDFAPLWHSRLLAAMSEVQLTILIGKYAQAYYLPQTRAYSLTETVSHYHDYLPSYFPLVHPSPLNFRWIAKNAWFERDIVPELQKLVTKILAAQVSPEPGAKSS